jgi:hypothetical protein
MLVTFEKIILFIGGGGNYIYRRFVTSDQNI